MIPTVDMICVEQAEDETPQRAGERFARDVALMLSRYGQDAEVHYAFGTRDDWPVWTALIVSPRLGE